MALALRLAAQGLGRTSPNPMVGAVVVAGGRIVGQGYHRQAGGPHAEVIALRKSGSRAKRATLYVTLEPCCHTNKRTPPCVPALLAAGLRRVVVAMPDPNPSVRGRGLSALRKAGLDVQVGCLRREAERLNEIYCHWITTGRPFVVLKSAMTLDGKIATASGESQWITGQAARRHGHGLRSRMDAILVGIGTVLKDDPQLTVRWTESGSPAAPDRQPLRVILDSRLRIPLSALVLSHPSGNRGKIGTVIATTNQAQKRRIDLLQSRGVDVLVLPAERGRVSFPACLRQLGRIGVTSLLIEGGSEVNASALRSRLVNRVCLYVAPRLLGGRDAIGFIGGPSSRRLQESMALTDLCIQPIGSDVLIEGTVAAGTSRPRTR
jgi:diaminohydroxyphosphoribosylaminopyrimidine deaminase/5-amino-6-(5-phosphoribosylamino)uracil reductase